RFDVQPPARKNEVAARVQEGLNDVPISRTGMGDWGIQIPGDTDHAIYVWIDALFNYYSTVDTDQRRKFWPADVHLIGKDILWFHAVIWPALLMALKLPLPRTVYAHSWWVKEVGGDSPIARKVSKSLGNLVTLEELNELADLFSQDAVRWYLATQGPLGPTDATFSDARFVEIYNSDLANTLGNSFSRVTNMTGRYFEGKVPPVGDQEADDLGPERTDAAVEAYRQAMDKADLAGGAAAALNLIREVDGYIERTAPFKLAKDPANEARVGAILHRCAEAIRIASVLLWPLMPWKMQALWQNLGCFEYTESLADRGRGDLETWCRWGGLTEDATLTTAEPLFPRYQPPKDSRD
ncbi:MAG: class I tRNA ligase family protein, partial [Phycisphaeraceae bacterium]|nr:class I tRNA ligase family protein [Phycisphaeraceae bacterium]